MLWKPLFDNFLMLERERKKIENNFVLWFWASWWESLDNFCDFVAFVFSGEDVGVSRAQKLFGKIA